MKTVYWRLKDHQSGAWTVEFWTKQDRSNALTATFVTLTEDTLRKRIEQETGMKNFDIYQVKDAGSKKR
jgi:hypothetical protein